MPTIWVRFGDARDYPVVINSGALEGIGRWVRRRVRAARAVVVTHPRLLRLYGTGVLRSLRAAGLRPAVIEVPEGEAAKTLAQAERIIDRLLALGADRGTCLVALGGGVLGDLAGFVAAVFMRGVPFVQLPTTLLAQVDASVGGKVAVNARTGKNLIGAFWQPRLVVTDPQVLRTLSPRQFRSGLSEIIKTAFISDPDFVLELERSMPKIKQGDTATLTRAIARSTAFKARVVEADETEQGRRAILNYGHTVGHALEAYHGFRAYTHGEAVALGMVAAARLGVLLKICAPETAARQEALIRRAGLPVRGRGEPPEALLRLMRADKKTRNGELNFVLTPTLGSARIVRKITPFSVRRVLTAVLGRVREA